MLLQLNPVAKRADPGSVGVNEDTGSSVYFDLGEGLGATFRSPEG